MNNIPKIQIKLENIIFQVRSGIPQCNKTKWYMIECSLDKFKQKVYKDLIPKIKKKKIGRPKKKDNNELNKMEAEIAGMAKFLGLDEN